MEIWFIAFHNGTKKENSFLSYTENYFHLIYPKYKIFILHDWERLWQSKLSNYIYLQTSLIKLCHKLIEIILRFQNYLIINNKSICRHLSIRSVMLENKDATSFGNDNWTVILYSLCLIGMFHYLCKTSYFRHYIH